MADRSINNGAANDGKMGLEALALSPRCLELYEQEE